MARILWNVLCGKASIDKQTNNISLFEVIEEIELVELEPKEPILAPCRMDFVVLTQRDNLETPENPSARVRIRSASGKILGSANIKVELENFKRCRSTFHMDVIPLDGSGQYEFIVEFLDGETWVQKSSLPLAVRFSAADPALKS